MADQTQFSGDDFLNQWMNHWRGLMQTPPSTPQSYATGVMGPAPIPDFATGNPFASLLPTPPTPPPINDPHGSSFGHKLKDLFFPDWGPQQQGEDWTRYKTDLEQYNKNRSDLMDVLRLKMSQDRENQTQAAENNRAIASALMGGASEVSPNYQTTQFPLALGGMNLPTSKTTPDNAFELGGRYFEPPSRTKGAQVVPGKDSFVGRAYKAAYGVDIPKEGFPDGYDPGKDPLLSHGIKYVEDQDKKQALTDHLSATGKQFKDMINGMTGIPKFLKDSYLQEWDNASTIDARSGVTTQTDQIWNKARTDLKQYDPEFRAFTDAEQKKKEDREVTLASRKAAAEETARWTVNDKLNKDSVDPDVIASHIRNIKNSGGDSQVYGNILRLYPGSGGKNQAYRNALAKGLADSGVNVVHLSNRALEAGQMAVTNLPHINAMLAKVNDPNFAKKLGVISGRYNDFLSGKVGAGDPDFAYFNGLNKMANSAMALIHMGQRGAGSAAGMEYMKQIADGGKMTPETFKSGVKAIKDFMEGYAKNVGPDSPFMYMGTPRSGLNYDAQSPSFNYTPDVITNQNLPPLAPPPPPRR